MDFRAPAEAETIAGSPFKKKKKIGDFPGGPLVKNLPCNTGDMGSIPGGGTKIPQASGQLLSPEPGHHN